MITMTASPAEYIDPYYPIDWLGKGGVKVGNSMVWNIGSLDTGQSSFNEAQWRTYSGDPTKPGRWITIDIAVMAIGMTSNVYSPVLRLSDAITSI